MAAPSAAAVALGAQAGADGAARSPAGGPSVTLQAPREAPPGTRIIARGRVTGLDRRASLQGQLSTAGNWKTVAWRSTSGGRFQLALLLPGGGTAARLRAVVVLRGRQIAVSPATRVELSRQAKDGTKGSPRISVPAPTASAPAPTAATPGPPEPPPETEPEPEPPLEPVNGVYWGGYIDPGDPSQPAPVSEPAIAAFEKKAGKAPSLLESFSAFAECDTGGVNCDFIPFPITQLEAIRKRGAVPLFTWASEATSGERHQPNFQLADLIEGKYDGYISAWAAAAKAWGHPFFLRFDWEMNGNWYPWSVGTVPVNGEAPEPDEEGEIANGNAPGEYVEAWQHVHAIFASVGATNATWVWCPYVDPKNNKNFADLEGLYPGDDFVDWTCLDGYNYGSHRPAGWTTFADLFGPQYAEIAGGFAATKPMLIGEVASTEAGGSKADWIGEMFAALPSAFPAVRGLLWFDYFYDGNDWWLASSLAAQQAFAAGVADPRYLGNAFGALASSPIPPP